MGLILRALRRLGPRLRSAALLAWALGLLALVAIAAFELFAPVVRWDVALTGQSGQLSIFNVTPEGGHYGMPVEMGDYDGDGRIDLVLAPMAADSGPSRSRPHAGEVYIYPGQGVIQGIVDRKTLGDRPPGLTIWGARADDFLGTELYSADVNGDGITDLLVSAQNYDGPDGTRDNCGGAFVVLGKPGLLGEPEAGTTIDLADPPEGVITIAGARPGERLGIWIEAGDLDGDGFADILIGADQASGPGATPSRFHCGEVVVIYGRADFPAVLDLAEAVPEPDPTLGISIVHGRDPEDHFGASIHARDLDRDGRAELIAAAALDRLSASYGGATKFPAHDSGAGDGPDNVRPECGEVYVIFSDPGGARLPPVIDMAAPPAWLEGRITTIYGQKKNEAAGEELATGDFNGDGYPDLAVGALTATGAQGELYAGAVHVIYFQPKLRGTVIDFQYPERFPPDFQFSDIVGLNQEDVLGDTLTTGDFDHDGFDDLAVGIPHDSHGTALLSGEVAILFGRAEPFPRRIFPDKPDAPLAMHIAYVQGANPVDFLSYSMEARDYDGDGYADLFPNAMRSDGSDGNALDAGGAYLLSGFYLSGGRLEVTALEPPYGPEGAETEVLVRGAGFTIDSDTRVVVGGQSASAVHVISGTRISCRVPPAAAGLAGVSVENRHGMATIAAAYRYLSASDFLRGDAEADGVLTISDAIQVLGFLFLGSPGQCLDAHDANDDGLLDISDGIYLLQALFGGGPPPPPPYPLPGPDPTPDGLGCP